MSFLVEVAVVAGAYIAGTVSPAIGRKIKAEVAKVKAEAAKLKADAKVDVTAVEKKL